MDCEHPDCHCQTEVGTVSDGREFCSHHCRRGDPNPSSVCRCGHVGCASADEWAEPLVIYA